MIYMTELEREEQELKEAMLQDDDVLLKQVRDKIIAKYTMWEYGIMLKRVINQIQKERGYEII